MSNQISLLKARYCRSVLKTAELGPDADARRLIDGLATEQPTPGVTAAVSAAEQSAIAALRTLSDHMQGRSIALATGEWTRARAAVEAWVVSAS